MTPRPPEIRHRVDPGDVPPEKAARRLHLSIEKFTEVLPKLLARGFPEADPDTGMYDLDAIDLWRRSRHRSAAALTIGPQAPQAMPQIQPSMADRFIANHGKTQERRRRRGTA